MGKKNAYRAGSNKVLVCHKPDMEYSILDDFATLCHLYALQQSPVLGWGVSDWLQRHFEAGHCRGQFQKRRLRRVSNVTNGGHGTKRARVGKIV